MVIPAIHRPLASLPRDALASSALTHEVPGYFLACGEGNLFLGKCTSFSLPFLTGSGLFKARLPGFGSGAWSPEGRVGFLEEVLSTRRSWEAFRSDPWFVE